MLFKRELKRNLKSFLVTILICGFMIVWVVSMSKKMGPDIKTILDLKFPGPLQEAFGMANLDFGSAKSFFALIFSYIYLFLAIYIAGVFATIMSKEFSDKTAEYLFSLPVPRFRIIATKLSVSLLYFVVIIILMFFLSWISFAMNIKGSFDLKLITLFSLAWLIGGLVFASLAFLISSFFPYSKSISSVSVILIMVMYMLQIVIAVNDKLDNLKYISPFDWFKGSEIANTMSLDTTYCLIGVFVIIVSIAIGFRRFLKSDVLI